MSYRDVVVTLTIVACLPYALLRPFFGLVLFTWLAYMRPQDLCWGFAKSIRFSLFVALLMYIGWFFFAKRRFTRVTGPMKWLVAFAIVVSISLFCGDLTNAPHKFSKWIDLLKVFLVAFFTVGMVDDRKRLSILMWTVTLSLGFYGVKCGIRTSLTGGRILQGPGGMMLDNNDLCLAMAMNLPLLFFMGRGEPTKWIRRSCYVAVALTCVTVVATVSRGGFLTMCLAGVQILTKLRRSIIPWIIAVVAVLLILFALPADLEKRLATLKDPSAESSASGRMYAWKVGMRMVARHPMFGVGFDSFMDQFPVYDPATEAAPSGVRNVIVAHNTYVQVWAEHGTPAILFFLAMIGGSVLTLRRAARQARRYKGLEWVQPYADMLEVSVLCFTFGAFFLNRAHFDLIYHLVAIATALTLLVRKEARSIGAAGGSISVGERLEADALEPSRAFGRSPGFLSGASGATHARGT